MAVEAEPSELELNGHTLQVRLDLIGINDLNSSCLLHIFSYFTIGEKRRLESVCRRWHRILREQRKRKKLKIFKYPDGWFKKDSLASRERNIGINHLNDDCLFEIFSYFSMKEKIGLELVCRRWRRVLLDQWKMTTCLNFEKEHHFVKFNVNILEGILEKCGPSIQRMDLPQFYILRRITVHLIANCCINLRHLSIQNLVLSSKDVEVVVSNLKHLKSLELKYPLSRKCHSFGFIGRVLEEIPLESFVFLHNRDGCEFLSSLPPTLKHLELISCHNLNQTCLISGLEKATNLQSFRISKVSNKLFCTEKFYSSISNVEEFSAVNITESYFLHGTTGSLHLYNRLHNLRKLSLKCSSFRSDTILFNISEGCKKLEVLDFSGCGLHNYRKKVSDRGIAALVKNCVLTDLSISNCPEFTDYGLSILANVGKLKKLSCTFCQNITDVGCSQLISLCLDLELLNIEYCKKISAVVITSAMSTISLRTEKKILHLFVKGTSILQSEIPDSNKSLEVHLETCIINCRQ